MIKKFLCILNCPYAVMALVTLLSFTALAAAFSSEAFLGLEPCILCIYQRWPYAIVLLIGIVTLVLKKHLGIAVGFPARGEKRTGNGYGALRKSLQLPRYKKTLTSSLVTRYHCDTQHIQGRDGGLGRQFGRKLTWRLNAFIKGHRHMFNDVFDFAKKRTAKEAVIFFVFHSTIISAVLALVTLLGGTA